MTTIYKYPMKRSNDPLQIELPYGAKFLCMQEQFGVQCLWYQVEAGAHKENKEIFIYGTGYQITNVENQKYLGTFQEMGGSLIWHVYQEI